MIDQLSPAQYRSILDSVARLNIWAGPVRSGKTFATFPRFAEECMAGPPGNFLIAGKTERTVKRNIVDPMRDLFGPHVIRHSIGTGEVRVGDRLCWVAGAHNEGSQDRIRGMTLAGALGDELTTWPESFFRMLLSRLSVPGAKFFGTTNPDAPAHWIKLEFLDRIADLDLKLFDDFRLEDNPALEQAFVDGLKAEYGPPGSLWYQRYILGRWVLAEGAIWSSFDRSKHLYSEPPEGGFVDWWLAVDYGTTNPFHALLIAQGRDDKLYVVREWRWDSRRKHKQLTDAEYSKELRAWLMSGAERAHPGADGQALPIALRRTIVDPSAASFLVQLWRDDVPHPTRANNAVLDGLRWTNTLLGADRLRIHESCVGLVAEIEGYVWDPKALERGIEQPLKRDDHGPDALRYGVMGTRRVWSRWVGAPVSDEDEEAA
jgi:PBSX family phage terminase large subunit